MASGPGNVQWYQTETAVTASIRLNKSEAVRPQFETRRCAVYVGGRSAVLIHVVLRHCSKELAPQ